MIYKSMFFLLAAAFAWQSSFAADSLRVNVPNVPLLNGKECNVLFAIDIVSDAAKLGCNIFSTFYKNDFFFENTIPDEVADELIVTVGTVLDPLLFLGCHAKRNDTVFVFFFHSKVLSIKN